MLLSATLYNRTYDRLALFKAAPNNDVNKDIIKVLSRYLIVSIIFIIIELLLLIYALKIAIQCPVSTPLKIVHVLLALFFTIPYVIIMYITGYCPSKTGGKKIKK